MLVPAFRKVGNSRVPVVLIPLTDGSHFLVHGEIVSPATLKSEFSHPEKAEGTFAIGAPVVAPTPTKG